jgi:hypothetical protein
VENECAVWQIRNWALPGLIFPRGGSQWFSFVGGEQKFACELTLKHLRLFLPIALVGSG